MKVTYNWLKDFVEIKLPPEALAEKLTMAGLEVTSLEEREGDFVFEIEITPNRPDWLSVFGIAREVAAITKSKIKNQKSKLQCKIQNSNRKASQLRIEIQDKKDCPLYTAKIIRGIRVGPSPDWLKKRLELVGCRSVNSVVDIANYILFTYGEPLHAFDLDKLSGNSIMVRRGRSNEKIILIGQAEKQLSPDILVIADAQRPVAIAGIMGGEDTEVTGNTKNILLEAAVFNPIVIRRARQNLSLESESSYRFERGVDLETCLNASSQALDLIQGLGAGECTLAKEAGLETPVKKTVNLDIAQVNKILGTKIPVAKIKSILEKLGFTVRPAAKNKLKVRVPAHRQDVNLAIDLAEEVARIYGYENIPTSIPKVLPNINVSAAMSLIAEIKKALVGLGLNEVTTYSLIDRGLLRGLGSEVAAAREILNPSSQEQEVLRPTLLTGILSSIAVNLNQREGYVNIFEVAKIFSGAAGSPAEELALGIGLCGAKNTFIAGKGAVKEEAGFLHLKGIAEGLFARLGVKGCAFMALDGQEKFNITVGKERLGIMSRVSRQARDNFEIKNKDVFVLEINLERLLPFALGKKKFSLLPVFPAVGRDISLVVQDDISTDEILAVIKEKAGVLLREAKVADFYQGKQIPAGFKGLTISCLYRSDERTLTEAEVNPLHNSACAVLTERFGAKIR